MPDPFFPNNEPLTLSRWRDIWVKIRSRGLGWGMARLAKELRVPQTTQGLTLRQGLTSVYAALAWLARLIPLLAWRSIFASRRRLIYFLDLDAAPVTFDIVNYLMAVEIERRRLGCTDVHVVIVPGRNRGFRDEENYEPLLPISGRWWRLHQVVIPSLSLLPSCSGYTVCSTRWQATLLRLLAGRVLPPGYWPAAPYSLTIRPVLDAARTGTAVLPGLEPPERARDYVRQWIEKRASERRVVAITLRQYDFEPARNSNISAWIEFARGLDPTAYLPVFLLDTEAAMKGLPSEFTDLTVFAEGPWNLLLRAAFYEAAFLNMAVVQGPMTLCWFNAKCRYVAFLSPESTPQTNIESMRSHGYMPGQSLPFATPFQKWVWEKDDLAAIMREFGTMVSAIESGRVTSAGT